MEVAEEKRRGLARRTAYGWKGWRYPRGRVMIGWRVAFWKEWWGLMAVDGGEQGSWPLCLREGSFW